MSIENQAEFFLELRGIFVNLCVDGNTQRHHHVRLIFISKNKYYDQIITNNLKELCEKDSIAFFYSYDEAQDFINNQIIRNQLPLDLIISENNIWNQKATDFYQSITKDKERTYSNFDFRFCTIPMVLIVDKDENKNAYTNYGFYDVVDNIGLDKLHLSISNFRSAVKSWRKKVLDELDNLGIKFNSGIIDYTFYFSEERKRDISTNILSENFKRFCRKLEYDWLSDNDKQIEKAIDEFIKELKKSVRFNKKKEEKKFHKLFNKYPFLIKRDNYSKHWHEPKLYYNEAEYFEPDYSLKPNFNHQTDLSILEVKLPNEAFIKKTKFHPKPYNNIIAHIFQVNDYKEYLESDEYFSTIEKVFGFVPDSIEYNILIGRLNDKTNNFSVFNKRMKQMNATHINFITYDELLDYQVKYFERTKILKII
ncbi:DUF4263 domain-containing protein [Parafilimonas terrae]|uniref:DUF4263 domain-containing protein n=1 Tax=Parafilimonas terrae TaxID=1465490 RepID=A0A1I5Z985_9BACT|nr:DUF4263 domain-containing protein [Parafilimonas terrae]SFQ53056.1 protein of unknown function [Parafilimonas terrae]